MEPVGNLDSIFKPQSVAVIAPPPCPESWGDMMNPDNHDES
jgi:hypothetical protein